MNDHERLRGEISGVLWQIISRRGQRDAIRGQLRTQVNRLSTPLEERKKLYRELKEKETALTDEIQVLEVTLAPEDRQCLLEHDAHSEGQS